MSENQTLDSGFRYRPDYEWPEEGTLKDCPRCNEPLELVENRESYYGKPWWCPSCQWQFSEEDLLNVQVDSKEEE